MLENWIEIKLEKGDERAAKFGRLIVEEFGDEPFPPPVTPVASERSIQPQVTIETPKVTPEITLEVVRYQLETQAIAYIDRDFHGHKNIGMSEGAFKDLIMGLASPQPEDFRGRFNTPLAVLGQIPPKDQCRLAGIEYYLEGLNVRDWPEDPKHYTTPQTAYITWTDEGKRFIDRKVQDVRKELAVDERGGTGFDGVALYVANPNILQERFLDLPGTAVASDRAAFLRLWDGRPRLDYYWVDHAYPGFGSLVCGRQK